MMQKRTLLGEALHDFRVSLRHLRSFLKSYEDFIKNAKKHRENFSTIMAMTNAGRDYEVHSAWLNSRAKRASDLEKSGLQYLLEQLNNKEQIDLVQLEKQFSKAADKLSKQWSHEIEKQKDSEAKKFKHEDSFAVATAQVLRSYGNDLKELLQKIETVEDDADLHEARITGKKLRYTLELLDTEEATVLVKELKKFQDAAGDLHDLQVLGPKLQTFLFAETVLWSQAFRDGSKTLSHTDLSQLPELQRSYSLAAVQRRLETEKVSLYDTLQKNWFGDTSKDFFENLNLFTTQLSTVTKLSADKKKATQKKSTVKKREAKQFTTKHSATKKAEAEKPAKKAVKKVTARKSKVQ
jgi:CHAD domain-containing protein